MLKLTQESDDQLRIFLLSQICEIFLIILFEGIDNFYDKQLHQSGSVEKLRWVINPAEWVPVL